jgi:hypothetical protein
MENPNVDEKEQAMGFCTCTTTMQGIFEGTCRQILGQLPHMDFQFGLGKTIMF